MSKKHLKTAGTVLTLLSFILMFFSWIYAYSEGEVVSADITTSGFGLTEFSVWGVILLIVPVLVLGIMYSNLGNKVKTVMILCIYLLSQISFYFAVSIGMDWLREISTEYVRPQIFLLIHPIMLFASLLAFYLHCNTLTNCGDEY